MQLDTSLALGVIHHSFESLQEEMLRVSRFTFHPQQSQDQSDQLQFLAPSRPLPMLNGIESHPPSSKNCCTCNDAPRFSHPGPQTLRLVRIQDCTHYLAVSYCWLRGDKPLESSSDNYYVEASVGSRRQARAPAHILRRAISYALANDISYIWIDQECVDQGDRFNKNAGIQSMSQVYRRAKYSVAMLSYVLTSQRQIDALKTISELQNRRPDQRLAPLEIDWEVLSDVLEHLADDEWFTRSWVLQEYALAKDMRFLAKHQLGLLVPGRLQVGGDQIELFPDHFTLTSIGRFITEGHLDTLILNRLQRAIDQITNSRAVLQPLGFSGRDMRYGSNASEALRCLRGRKNTRAHDRLTIVANLCDYRIHIDTYRINPEEYSFSVCLLTLALLNGDTSVLYFKSDGLRAVTPMPQLANSWIPSFSTTLDQLQGVTHIGTKIRFEISSISDRGLTCNGFLSKLDTNIDMTNIQRRYSAEYRVRASPSSQEPNNCDEYLDMKILLAICHTLEEHEYQILANVLKDWMRKNSWDKLPSAQTTPNEPGIIDGENQFPHHGLGTQGLRWLIEQVMDNGNIWCGTFGSWPTKDGPSIIFDCSKPSFVFTPYSPSFDNLPTIAISEAPISWMIDCGTSSPAAIQMSTGGGYLIHPKIQSCGIFPSNVGRPESYTLAWPVYGE